MENKKEVLLKKLNETLDNESKKLNNHLEKKDYKNVDTALQKKRSTAKAINKLMKK